MNDIELKVIIEVLKETHKEYLSEAKESRSINDYWHGKASGIQLAIELLESRI